MAIIPRNKRRFLSTALSLSFLTTMAVAQPSQAQEESMGHYNGTTQNVFDHDLATLGRVKLHDSNPATYSFYGNGRVRLPSVRLDVGANVPVMGLIDTFTKLGPTFTDLSSAFTGGTTLTTSQSDKIVTELTGALAPFQKGVRLDYDIDVGILGVMLNPVKIQGRKLSLGINLGAGTQSYAAINFSKEFSDGLTNIVKSVPDVAGLVTTATTLQTQATSLTANATQLSASAAGLTNLAAIGDANAIVQELDTAISALDNLISPANQISSDVSTAITTGEKLVGTINTASQGGINVDAVVDGHMTVALSGAYELIKNNNMTVSVGSNLKFFVLPFNMPVTQFLPNSTGTANLMGQYKLTEVAGVNAITGQVQSTIDGVKPAVNNFKSLTTDAEKIKQDLTSIRNQVQGVQNDPLGAAALFTDQQFLNSAQSIGGTANTMIESVNSTVTQTNQAFSDLADLQKNLNFNSLILKGSVINPANVGFGLDLGINAFLLRNSLWVGLNVINPVVVWGATQKDVSFSPFNNALIVDDENAKQVNYTASEPFGLNFGTRFYFDQVLRGWKGLSVGGQFDFLANGRSPGLTLDAQQQFGAFFMGLGFRGGYISNLIMFKTGVRGPFGLELGAGVSPDLSGAMANLGLYVQF